MMDVDNEDEVSAPPKSSMTKDETLVAAIVALEEMRGPSKDKDSNESTDDESGTSIGRLDDLVLIDW